MGDALNDGRNCRSCAKWKPLDAFPLRRSSGYRGRTCTECESTEGPRFTPAVAQDTVRHVNRHVEQTPERAPAERMRAALADCRERRTPFHTAWPMALDAALSGLPKREAEAWRSALTATRPAWGASYNGVPWPSSLRPTTLFLPDEDDAERVAVAA